MAIDPVTVEHVAKLARVSLTDDEKARFVPQLARIVEHYKALRAIAPDAAPPVHVSHETNALRDDVVTPSLPQSDVLAAAPAHDGAYIIVPPVFESD